MADVEAADTATLWTIFGYIGQNWGTAQTCNMPQAQFNQVIAWQVARDPAYSGYYAEAVTEYQALYAKYGPAALAVLYQENQLSNPKLPQVANFVLLEFMRWNVAFGGFRSFQYENYNGWMGGGSYLNRPPPYRALPMVPAPPSGAQHDEKGGV
jgi:hypothetical protein